MRRYKYVNRGVLKTNVLKFAQSHHLDLPVYPEKQTYQYVITSN